ncbi:helix-turn-helix domain-containing protein [Dolichospermum circinale]|uniref:helix-turn-helix domain-containing protein n=1 Tax=Dolichospermum circinale TaxID=109265 RepID=UPI00232DA825|nr:helix-turn-helix domain-containing protein [Dolichospermum circinale]MDB9468994.1 helix-turn-helix domain-containing protein [Dolichospermum circinale CS-539/09]MDB9469146.1 helix-turn-helix domain-containing protein [Dolichospermum circinale CS-539]
MSEQHPHGNSQVVTHQFNDLDRFVQAIKPLNIKEGNQLSPGGFLGTLNFADFGDLKFTHLHQNQSAQATGTKYVDNICFVLAFKPDFTQVSSHGCVIQKHDIFGFDPTREVDVVVSKDVHLVMASVNAQTFYTLYEQMGYEMGQKVLQNNALSLHPSSLRPLKAYYQQITHILSTQPSLLIQSQIQSLIIEDFLPLLINTFGNNAQKKQRILRPFRRYSLIRKAEEVSKSYRDKPLTLQKLCEELETSSSALCCGFQEVFGISPVAYIKIQRLNGVRRALMNADPNIKTVMEVAQEWGFWNAPHFAKDYREMFGELPSKTLRGHLQSSNPQLL